MSFPQSRLKASDARRPHRREDAAVLRAVHARAGGHGAAALSPLGGQMRNAPWGRT